jgi:hypothetical protein
MVKNVKGGKGSKGFARKLHYTPVKTTARVPENSLEVFAIVSKFYGNMCDVTTIDEKTYKCAIRKKFRGRFKMSSIIAVGNIVLVGFRDFEAPNFKNCDLLETYDPADVRILSNMPGINIQPLIAIQNAAHTSSSSSNDFNVDFYGNDNPDMYAVVPTTSNTGVAPSIQSEEEINPDDI